MAMIARHADRDELDPFEELDRTPYGEIRDQSDDYPFDINEFLEERIAAGKNRASSVGFFPMAEVEFDEFEFEFTRVDLVPMHQYGPGPSGCRLKTELMTKAERQRMEELQNNSARHRGGWGNPTRQTCHRRARRWGVTIPPRGSRQLWKYWYGEESFVDQFDPRIPPDEADRFEECQAEPPMFLHEEEWHEWFDWDDGDW